MGQAARAVDFDSLPATNRTEINRRTDETFWKKYKEWDHKYLKADSPIELRRDWMRMRREVMEQYFRQPAVMTNQAGDDDLEKFAENATISESQKLNEQAASARARTADRLKDLDQALARESAKNAQTIQEVEVRDDQALASSAVNLAETAAARAAYDGSGDWEVVYETRNASTELAPIISSSLGEIMEWTDQNGQVHIQDNRTPEKKAADEAAENWKQKPPTYGPWSRATQGGFKSKGQAEKWCRSQGGNDVFRVISIRPAKSAETPGMVAGIQPLNMLPDSSQETPGWHWELSYQTHMVPDPADPRGWLSGDILAYKCKADADLQADELRKAPGRYKVVSIERRSDTLSPFSTERINAAPCGCNLSIKVKLPADQMAENNSLPQMGTSSGGGMSRDGTYPENQSPAPTQMTEAQPSEDPNPLQRLKNEYDCDRLKKEYEKLEKEVAEREAWEKANKDLWVTRTRFMGEYIDKTCALRLKASETKNAWQECLWKKPGITHP